MRLPDNGRAAHPKLRPSSIRHYTLDEVDVDDEPNDLAVGAQLVAFGSQLPAVVRACTPRARRCFAAASDAMVEAFADPDLIAALLEDHTIGILFRRHTRNAGSEQALFAVSGASDDTGGAPDNYLAALVETTTGQLKTAWEHSVASTTIATTFDNARVEAFAWTYAVLRKSLVTGPGPAGTCTIDLMINGAPCDSVAGLVNASHGTAAALRLNHEMNAALAAVSCGDFDIAGFYVWTEALTDAEIAEDARRIRQQAFWSRRDVAVRITDEAGATHDLTNLEGVDFVDKVEITDEIDQPTLLATVSLMREQEALTLAGLRTDSKLNLADVADVTSYAPLIRDGATIEILTARVPLGIRARADELTSRFLGSVDDIEEGGEGVSLHCRDEGGRLIDTFIEEEVDYGSDDTPFAVEGEMQAILDDNDSDTGNNSVAGLTSRTGSYAPITLDVPVAPSWAIALFRQRREPVLSALRALAGQIAWECRYRYVADPFLPGWRLSLYEPDRRRVQADAVIARDDVLNVTSLSRSLLGRRNVIRVVYPSSETTLPTLPSTPAGVVARRDWSSVDGEGGRVNAFVELQSDTSIAASGRRHYMEAVEEAASQVDTVTEAFAFALGMLLDLAEPDLGKSIEIESADEVELNDMLRFEQPLLHTAPQTLAVKRVTHSYGERATSTIEVRGKPSVGYKRWLRLEARGGGKPPVANPLEALTDWRLGNLLGTFRAFLDKSAYFKGGRFLQLRNGDFASFSAGLANPPDGWSLAAGAWDTDADVSVSSSLSGGKAVRLLTTTAQLRSDPVPINASGSAYTVEVTWLRAAGDDLVQIDVEWRDAAKVLLSTDTLYPGATPTATIVADNFPAASAATGVWIVSRADGLDPPSSGLARFASVVVRGRQVGGAFSTLAVDGVAFFRSALRSKTGLINPTGAYAAFAAFGAPTGVAAGTARNVPFFSVASSYLISGATTLADLYDVGRNLPLSFGPTVGGPGGHFVAREGGTYRIRTKIWFGISGAFPAGGFAGIEIVKNAAYSTAGVRTGGTVVDAERFVVDSSVAPLTSLGAHRLSVDLRLEAGDRISVDLVNHEAAGTVSAAVGDTFNVGNNDYSFLSAVQILNE